MTYLRELRLLVFFRVKRAKHSSLFHFFLLTQITDSVKFQVFQHHNHIKIQENISLWQYDLIKKRELKMTFKLVLTTANSIIGVSILSMPYCYKECGKSRISLLNGRNIKNLNYFENENILSKT